MDSADEIDIYAIFPKLQPSHIYMLVQCKDSGYDNSSTNLICESEARVGIKKKKRIIKANANKKGFYSTGVILLCYCPLL